MAVYVVYHVKFVFMLGIVLLLNTKR